MYYPWEANNKQVLPLYSFYGHCFSNETFIVAAVRKRAQPHYPLFRHRLKRAPHVRRVFAVQGLFSSHRMPCLPEDSPILSFDSVDFGLVQEKSTKKSRNFTCTNSSSGVLANRRGMNDYDSK